MKYKLKSIYFLLWLVVFTASFAYSQAPPGYYNGTEGLSGEALRSALFEIINDHNVLSYASLWTHFQSTDKKPDGKVWDMYSDVPGGTPAYTYTFVVDQCGNYGSEGDCYNREHSFPSSWFNDASPMQTDIFHIYPTDGFVNGKRSNYPYGEVGSASWTSTNGSMLGNNTFPGYSGVVLEPIDEYKGDFARTYFYMVTCYLDKVSSWNSPMLAGNNLSTWSRDMLVGWSYEDPVSDKETGRNDAVYDIQDNRNPYIDHPEWVGAIWGAPVGMDDACLTASGRQGRWTDGGLGEGRFWYANGIIHGRFKEADKGVLQVSTITGHLIETFIVNDPQEDYAIDLLPGVYILTYIDDNIKLNNKVMVTGR